MRFKSLFTVKRFAADRTLKFCYICRGCYVIFNHVFLYFKRAGNNVFKILICHYVVPLEYLKELPERQIANGFAEIIKMAVTFDEELFEVLEREDVMADKNLEDIIARALEIKKDVVENDEKEKGERKALNFGHTIGHGIEFQQELSGLYHGECVAIGMLPMCSAPVRARLRAVLGKVGLPVIWKYDIDKIYSAVLHDKKLDGSKIALIMCDKVGSYRINKISVKEFYGMLKDTYL